MNTIFVIINLYTEWGEMRRGCTINEKKKKKKWICKVLIIRFAESPLVKVINRNTNGNIT